MQRIALFGLAALGLGLGTAHEARANEPTPLTVNFTFRFDVRTNHLPPPGHPWWMYFPYDPHLMTPAPRGSPYPHWPAPSPGPDAQQVSAPRQPYTAPYAAPNIAWQPGTPAPIRPASFQPAPGFAFDR